MPRSPSTSLRALDTDGARAIALGPSCWVAAGALPAAGECPRRWPSSLEVEPTAPFVRPAPRAAPFDAAQAPRVAPLMPRELHRACPASSWPPPQPRELYRFKTARPRELDRRAASSADWHAPPCAQLSSASSTRSRRRNAWRMRGAARGAMRTRMGARARRRSTWQASSWLCGELVGFPRKGYRNGCVPRARRSDHDAVARLALRLQRER